MAKPEHHTRAKGQFLEKLSAALCSHLGDNVETNVFLPAIGGNGRKREIDVLISIGFEELGDCQLGIPIECKNWGKPIGIGDIDAFIGKLDDLGIPSNQGIYIAAKTYASGAIERAKKAGIKTLVASGLTEDRLGLEVKTCLHEITFWVPEFLSASLFQYVPTSTPPKGFIAHSLSQNASLELAQLDGIWDCWMSKKIPLSSGEHNVFLYDEDNRAALCSVIVTAHKLSVFGENTNPKLVDINNDAVFSEKSTSLIKIPLDPIELLNIEGHASNISQQSEVLSVNIRVPRLRTKSVYWPLSEQTSQKIREYIVLDLRPSFDQIEGRNILNAWI